MTSTKSKKEASIYKQFNLKVDDENPVALPKEETPELEEQSLDKTKDNSITGHDNTSFRASSLRNSIIQRKSSKRKTPKGRLYSRSYSQRPGGIHVDDCLFGLKLAHISCTDDTGEGMKTCGPAALEAMKLSLGTDNNDDLYKPLSTILRESFDLKLDYFMDESGMRYGRPIDTQGFIASSFKSSNGIEGDGDGDDIIVVSYRYTTTMYDWLTNLDMTSSEWEPDVDELIGHAGHCSCLDGLFTKYCLGRGKPRVHTGFYK